jgi:hypothetical protein
MSLYLGGPGDGGKGDVLEEDNEYGRLNRMVEQERYGPKDSSDKFTLGRDHSHESAGYLALNRYPDEGLSVQWSKGKRSDLTIR